MTARTALSIVWLPVLAAAMLTGCGDTNATPPVLGIPPTQPVPACTCLAPLPGGQLLTVPEVD